MTVTLREIFTIGAGSFCGGAARFLLGRALQGCGGLFPIGTLTVNIAGCLLLGFISALAGRCADFSAAWRLFLTVGFCGGFTTFSTFMAETGQLTAEGLSATALLYAASSLLLGFAALFAGQFLGRLL